MKKKEHWFRYDGIRGLPKPVSWQGWCSYGLLLLFSFLSVKLIIKSSEYSSTSIVLILALFLALFIILTVLKSNYRENIEKYGVIKSSKKVNNDIYARSFFVLGLLILVQGFYFLYKYGKVGFILFILAAIFFGIFYNYRIK